MSCSDDDRDQPFKDRDQPFKDRDQLFKDRDQPFKDRDQPFKGRNKYFNLIAYYPHRKSLPPTFKKSKLENANKNMAFVHLTEK